MTAQTMNRRESLLHGLLALAQDAEAPALDPAAPAWVAGLRKQALDAAPGLPVPTTRHEEWRFTPIDPILGARYAVAPAVEALDPSALDGVALSEAANSRLVFVNGRFAPALSSTQALGDGVHVGRLADIIAQREGAVRKAIGAVGGFDEDLFAALNLANLSDAACVVIDADTKAEAPIHLIFVTAADNDAAPDDGEAWATFPRVAVVAERGSKAQLIEDHISVGLGADEAVRALSLGVSEAVVGPDASLDHIKLLRSGGSTAHVARSGAEVSSGGAYRSLTVTLGPRWTRHDIRTRQMAPGTHCELHGLAYLRGRQLSDTHSVMDHAFPHGTSDQVHKIIADDRARGVFNGKIFVRKDAQKTAAEQLNRSLLLSDGARVDTKPQLEIFADDVRCTHGATIGQLEQAPLFYLQSRGIPADQARQLLVYAFASAVVERVPIDALRLQLQRALAERFDTRMD